MPDIKLEDDDNAVFTFGVRKGLRGLRKFIDTNFKVLVFILLSLIWIRFTFFSTKIDGNVGAYIENESVKIQSEDFGEGFPVRIVRWHDEPIPVEIKNGFQDPVPTSRGYSD